MPSLIVLDGLDEVGNVSDRKRVVDEIDLFCARARSYSVIPKIVVTTRPNSAGLPEPSPDRFEVITLSPLDHARRDEYLRKWCAVHGVFGNDNRVLRRNFNEKTKEPYIGELAGNPMQLTILLYLLRQHGDGTPNQRTELYDSYMALLLSREANKRPDTVRKHRADVIEIVPFLGWYLQSRGEEEGHSGRMGEADIKAAMKHFQSTYGKSETVVDELMRAAGDRLWALTSKEQGTFEFEVLSLREYFAANFLWFSAGEGDPEFDRTVVLRELLRRPYWLNTARFYGGNARGSELYILEAGIRQELRSNGSKQVRVGAWSLIVDGVFNSRPHEARSIVDALTDERGSRLLLSALDTNEIVPLPDGRDADMAWERLTTEIARDPSDPGNARRVRVIRELFGLRAKFAEWWLARLAEALLSASSEVAWLTIGARCEAVGVAKANLPGLEASDGVRAQLILNCGFVPEPGSVLEMQLLSAVLAGQCTETTSVRSLPAQVAVALSPVEFFSFGAESGGYKPAVASADRRSMALQHLRKSAPEYAEIATMRRHRVGESGSTFPWARVAAALNERFGRCWLASEIAVLGAAAPQRLGVTRVPGAVGLGSSGHPSALIADTRAAAGDAAWWREAHAECGDELSRAEWALAFWAIAGPRPFAELASAYEQTISSLGSDALRALEIAAGRLAESGWLPARDRAPYRGDNEAGPGATNYARGLSADIYSNGDTIESSEPAMAEVARREKWLKVDRVATYR